MDDFIKEVGETDKYQGITKKHWKPQSSSKKCSNKECLKAFTFTERKHHCRKCGEVFCKPCVSYEKRLNYLAKGDPNGRLYKVCQACFDQPAQSLGFSKSWTHVLKLYRARGDAMDISGPITRTNSRLNHEKEWQRLKEGFERSVTQSSVKRALSDIKNIVSVPEWQKSPYIVHHNSASRCRLCLRDFSLTRSKLHCCVCGAAVCTSCSNKNLLVYIENTAEATRGEPQLCVIKIVGCPPVEPDLSTYLRACQPCLQAVEDDQVAHYTKSIASQGEAEPTDNWQMIDSWNTKFREFEQKVEQQLPVYQDLVDFLESGVNMSNNSKVPKSKSNTQTLAKAQCDLSDHLSRYVVQIFTFKQISPSTPGQTTVYRNIIRCKCEFYQENMYIFREAKKRLAESTPQEVLEVIQRTVDQNAINSCSLTLKQLALEVLHLSTKYKVHETLPERLAVLDQIVEDDLRQIMLTNSEPPDTWETHSACAQQLIKDRLTSGQKFIRPSRTLTRRYGAAHVEGIVRERCDVIARQVLVQLEAKSAHKSFAKSKEQIRLVQREITQKT